MGERPAYTTLSTNYLGLRLILPQLRITAAWQYALAVLGFFGLALFQQFLEHVYSRLDEHCRSSRGTDLSGCVTWPMHFARTGLFVVRIALAYLFMWTALYFDVGLILALLCGATLGFLLLRRQIQAAQSRRGKEGPGAV